MTDFKAGDKVRVTNIYGGTSDNRVGAEGTIKRARAGGDAFNVTVENRGHHRFGQELIFYSSELELVKPEPKFAVGDWVKVHGRHDKWDGTVGTVVTVSPKAYSHYGHLYTILRNNKAEGEDHTLRFFEGALEATEAPAKFPVGTLVTFAEPDNDRWQGGKGEVIESKGWGRFNTTVRIIDGPPKNDMYAANYGAEVNFDPAHLELWVAPKPVFKVGDEVEFLKFWAGTTGTVIAVDDEIWPIRVKKANGGVTGRFTADELKLAEPAPKFAKGGLTPKQEFGPINLYNYAEFDAKLTAKVLGQFEDKPEAVKHPAHYGGDTTYEAIKVIEAWGLGFNLGNAAKYLARAGKKGNKVEDLNKLVFYVQREIAKEEAK